MDLGDFHISQSTRALINVSFYILMLRFAPTAAAFAIALELLVYFSLNGDNDHGEAQPEPQPQPVPLPPPAPATDDGPLLELWDFGHWM